MKGSCVHVSGRKMHGFFFFEQKMHGFFMTVSLWCNNVMVSKTKTSYLNATAEQHASATPISTSKQSKWVLLNFQCKGTRPLLVFHLACVSCSFPLKLLGNIVARHLEDLKLNLRVTIYRCIAGLTCYLIGVYTDGGFLLGGVRQPTCWRSIPTRDTKFLYMPYHI